MRKLIPLIIIVFTGCTSISQKQNSERENYNFQNDSTQKTTQIEKIRFPKSEFEITEGGIGKLLLGDPFSSVEKKYSKIDILTMSSEGNDWPAKRIDLGNGEWILVESNDGGEKITRIHTNSQKYKTMNGFYIGQKLGEIIKSGEEIGIDIDEGFMSIRLYGEKISVRVDSSSEYHFFKTKNQDITDIPKNAKIVEFGIF